MTIRKDFTIKSVEELIEGELFSLADYDQENIAGVALAIALSTSEEQGARSVVILHTSCKRPNPYRRWIALTDIVMSYGSEWVIDLGTASNSAAGIYAGADDPGAIVLHREGKTVMKAAGDGHRASDRGLTFDLNEFQTARVIDMESAVVIREWKLWLSEAERSRIGGRPLIDFKA